MRLSGWDSGSLLIWLSQRLNLRGAKARWWHEHGAYLVDTLFISGSALTLCLVAWLIWQNRARFIKTGGSRVERTIWALLVVCAITGSGLIFSLASLPTKADNTRHLAAMVPSFPKPVYTDQFTINQLAYLLHYHTAGIQNAGALDDQTMAHLLNLRSGCIIVNEPELDQLAGDGFHVSKLAYGLLQRQPRRWTAIKRFPSADNALEQIAIFCVRR